jgi:hypothetical protein
MPDGPEAGPESGIFWPCERLILERVATLRELEEWYSLPDVMERNKALDLRAEAQRKAQEQRDRQ